jgi:hypothetical protein
VIKVKNVRPGLLLVADAGLRLAPGETASVEKLTSQMERCLEDGLLTRIDSEREAKPRPKGIERNTESKQGLPDNAGEAAGTVYGNTAADPAVDDATKDPGLLLKTVGSKNGPK